MGAQRIDHRLSDDKGLVRVPAMSLTAKFDTQSRLTIVVHDGLIESFVNEMFGQCDKGRRQERGIQRFTLKLPSGHHDKDELVSALSVVGNILAVDEEKPMRAENIRADTNVGHSPHNLLSRWNRVRLTVAASDGHRPERLRRSAHRQREADGILSQRNGAQRGLFLFLDFRRNGSDHEVSLKVS